MIIDLTQGGTLDFTGAWIETKKCTVPVLDKNKTPVNLVGYQSIVMQTYGRVGGPVIQTYTAPCTMISKGTGDNHLDFDLTDVLYQKLYYKIIITLNSGAKFRVRGYINITD